MAIPIQLKRMSSFTILHFIGIHTRHSTPSTFYSFMFSFFLHTKNHIFRLNENGEEDKNK